MRVDVEAADGRWFIERPVRVAADVELSREFYIVREGKCKRATDQKSLGISSPPDLFLFLFPLVFPIVDSRSNNARGNSSSRFELEASVIETSLSPTIRPSFNCRWPIVLRRRKARLPRPKTITRVCL